MTVSKIFACVLLAVSFVAPATGANRFVIDSIGVRGTTDTSTLRGGTWSLAGQAKISVTCYYPGLVSAICSGGGDFDRALSSDTTNCGTGVNDNDGTIIKDAGGNCFYRKNFGLNGVVDARQCGVIGDGADHSPKNDGELLNACLTLASTFLVPASQFGVRVVNTGGGVILDNTTDIAIPANVELTCGGNNAADAVDDDYRILDKHGVLQLTNAIVLDPQHTISMPHVMSVSNSVNASFTGCILEAGVGTGDTPNTYSPSVWYPNCDHNATIVVPCTEGAGFDLRSAIDEQSAFNPNQSSLYPGGGPASSRKGISISADHVTVRNVTVLGFGTCYSLLGADVTAARPIIDHLVGDCDTGISIVNSNNPHIDSFNIHPFLTGGGDAAEQHEILGFGTSGTNYTVKVKVATTTGAFRFANGDTVWIALDDGAGAVPGGGSESARGRWIVSNLMSDTSCPPPFASDTCQPFTLYGSVSSPTTVSGHVSNVLTNGIPSTAITAITSSLQFVAPGQIVSDAGGCFPASPETDVVAVWPARGIVYVSAPAACTPGTHSITFTDHGYTQPLSDTVCSADPSKGCATVTAAFRFGNGVYANNVGGISAVNCNVFEHQVSYHLSTGANGSRWSNCATGDNINLPQRNIEDVGNSIISILIDGAHGTYDPGDASKDDSCDNSWANSILGQHRPVVLVVQSNCPAANKLVNSNVSVDNSQSGGIVMEVDGGGVLLASSYESGGGAIFKAEKSQYGGDTATKANLNISNNSLSDATLYIEDTDAGATTVGCGNVFNFPTPYLCAPSSFAQLPGGRLTLTQGQPVMTADVTGAAHVYYAPYTGQQLPIYNSATGAFGLADMTAAGLTFDLVTTTQVSGYVYDLFAEMDSSNHVSLCSGPAWSLSGVSRSAQISQIDGIWVNMSAINCNFNSGGISGVHACLPSECTYLGSAYMTANGQTQQQFGPVSGPGGGAPCLCLYNAYNHIKVSSKSLDTNNPYTYNTSIWRYMDNSANNSVMVLDGLGQSQIAVQLTDALSNGGTTGAPRIAATGVDFLPPGGSITAPTLIAKANSTMQGSYNVGETAPPIFGLWSAHALEKALTGTTGNATFGGSGFQEINLQVDD
jgi:hypothetical protein